MHKKSFARKGDADRAAAETEIELARGTYVDPNAGMIKFRDFAEQWRRVFVWKAEASDLAGSAPAAGYAGSTCPNASVAQCRSQARSGGRTNASRSPMSSAPSAGLYRSTGTDESTWIIESGTDDRGPRR
jgi:hypothetical protein